MITWHTINDAICDFLLDRECSPAAFFIVMGHLA